MDIRGDLLLTTQRYGQTMTTLWNFPDIEMRKDFEDPQVSWAQFSNSSAGRIVLTHEKEAVLWDTESDRALLRLPFGDKGCCYKKNRSFFSPSDDQILSGN
jgi:hypothetical protein